MPRRHNEKRCSTVDFFESQISKLELPLKDATCNGIRQTMDKLMFRSDGEKHELIDSDIIADNSYKSYAKQFRGFFKFLALIGDYDSMLVFHNQKSRMVAESMVAESVALYIIYKTKKSTENLTKLHNRTLIMKDIFGNEMKCCGDWNYTGNADQFLNAITAIHKSIRQTGAYTEPCIYCIAAWQSNENSTGCRHHMGEYKFYRRGNPRYSNEVTKAMSIAADETQNHQSRKCAQLLPSEVETLRQYLFGTNKIADYQLYVMILIGIHMFLRFDEVANFSFHQYLPEFTVVRSDGYIEKLLFKVKGKADKQDVYLSLKRNDDFPKLCPIRHLLFYIHVTRIRQGYIFPDLIHKKDKYEYKQFNNTIKDLIKDQLGKTERISTHFLRNTGYLFAKFGEGTFEVIQRAARHKSTSTAVAYYSDAETLFNSFKGTEAALVNKVPQWHDIWVNNIESYRTMHTGRVYSLEQLANRFVVEVIGQSNCVTIGDNSTHVDLKKLLSMVIQKGKLSLLEEMKQALRNGGANTHQIDIAVMFFLKGKGNEHINSSEERIANAPINRVTNALGNGIRTVSNISLSRGNEIDLNSTADRVILNNRIEALDHSRPTKRSRKNGTEDIEGRKQIKKLPPKDRLSVLLELYNENAAKTKNSFTGGARTFFYNVLKPVHDCFKNHFQNDEVAFYEKHTLSDYSRFKKHSCTGLGNSCNVNDS